MMKVTVSTLLLSSTVSAFVAVPATTRPHALIRLERKNGAEADFDKQDEDDECADEEECDIDWDRMPNSIDDDKDAANSMRARLEMNWMVQENIQECELERMRECSSSACGQCLGGSVRCRFCHGSGMFAGQPCKVCSTLGRETCRNCKGTGWIADFTAPQLQP